MTCPSSHRGRATMGGGVFADEMAQGLIRTALLEELGSIPSTHIVPSS